MKQNIVFLLLFFYSLNLNAQSQWYGYGIGLGHIEILDDQIKLRTFNMSFEESYDYFLSKRGVLRIINNSTDEYEHQPLRRAKYLNPEKDSLILYLGKQEYKFYKDFNYVNIKPISFHSFSYELLSPFKTIVHKIELSKHGVLRESDGTNKTLFELQIGENELKEFYQNLEKLDLKNMHLTNRRYNICDNEEYRLTFVDSYQNRYSYTSIFLIKTLKPIFHTIKNMLEKHKRKE